MSIGLVVRPIFRSLKFELLSSRAAFSGLPHVLRARLPVRGMFVPLEIAASRTVYHFSRHPFTPLLHLSPFCILCIFFESPFGALQARPIMPPKFRDGDVVVSVSSLLNPRMLQLTVSSSMANGSPGCTLSRRIQHFSAPLSWDAGFTTQRLSRTSTMATQMNGSHLSLQQLATDTPSDLSSWSSLPSHLDPDSPSLASGTS
jgi:hypothetical protein